MSIADLADRHHVPLAELVPAGIDGGLVAVAVLDLVLTWFGTPVGWLRQLVRVLSVGTVAANAVGGWPDPIAIGMHAAAPLTLLAMIEAGRTVPAASDRPGTGHVPEADSAGSVVVDAVADLLAVAADGVVADHQLPHGRRH